MKDQLDKLKHELDQSLVHTAEELEKFKIYWLGKKGELAALFDQLKALSAEQKKQWGREVNDLKKSAEEKFDSLSKNLRSQKEAESTPDLSLPVFDTELGNRHPLALIENRIITIFSQLGFSVAYGPEIDNDWNNFTALNFPDNHPAREMQDTFFIQKNPDVLLRTHTSNVQVRLLQEQKPPVRAIMPGRVYRNETVSARAHCFFHQVEILYVNTKVSFTELKQTLFHFVKEMFGAETQIRFRPSYFPFTEPSAEIDISCLICHGKGCTVCKHSGWVEIGGSGMVHPNVLKNAGLNPEKYSGFAAGMGIERIAMLKYGINDLRLFSENDVRFLQQFNTEF